MEFITHHKHATNLSALERTASVIAGGALSVWGIRRQSPAGFAVAALGAEFVRRGATGHCYVYNLLGVRTAPLGQGAETTSVPYELGIRVDRSVTVDRPRPEVYRFWRDFRNLPRFMRHVESVTVDGNRSHWVVRAPAGFTVEWDAEINNEIENELIGWRSLHNSSVEHAGSVHFKDAPGGRGAIVSVELQYNPPGGILGAFVARLFGEEPGQQIQEDLHRFKQTMEAGEIVTTEGQPSGRAQPWQIAERISGAARVGIASEESFPASDAPAWRS
ncbi:MAG: SRPBCC family protein [Bryobacteraceae bacterium]